MSSARVSVVHRRNEVGFLPARASQASTSEDLHARRVCSFTLSRHGLGVRNPSSADRTSSPKAIPKSCQGAAIADYLFNQRLFWAALSPKRKGVSQQILTKSIQLSMRASIWRSRFESKRRICWLTFAVLRVPNLCVVQAWLTVVERAIAQAHLSSICASTRRPAVRCGSCRASISFAL